MIGYVTLGTNNIERAAAFYDALLQELNASRLMETPRFIAWAVVPGEPMISIMKPFDGNAATVGNGVMVALAAEDKQQVQAVYNKAMALGAVDEGAPGPRGPLYAAYFRDPDGNKLNAYCIA